ncbi:MAG: SDR family oxidoreductase [Cyclobacteriaceae bacterium]
MSYIADKVCWITGASSGIGEALSIAMSQEGAKLILSARRETELQRVKQHCMHPERVKILPLDLTETESFREKCLEAIALFGKIDILVNNGGISQLSLAKDTSLEVDRKIMEVNFFGTIGLTKALLPHFMENNNGHIVVISSLVGKFGSPLRSGYSASKHALHGFFDALRAEHYRDHIRVTMVCPGFIKTQVSVNALIGTGEKQNSMDSAQNKGMPAMECARQIISAIRKNKEEVYIGGKEKYAVYLKRFFPTLFSKILKRAKVT